MVIDLTKRPRPQQCVALIESKVHLTKNVYLLNLRMQTPSSIAFLPGQTISLHVGEKLNRSLSISNVPSDNTHILLCHDVSPMGPASQWTLASKVGDEAKFMAPLGIFILDTTSQRKKVLVATGTGIAPFRSMLQEYLSQGGSDDITLYWGLRYEDDVYWVEEFEELAQNYPNFRFVLILSRAGEKWAGKRGHVTEHVLADEANLPGSEFYLCGNKEMVREMDEKLAHAGVAREQIYKELYF
jgi:NAD(P)H-flavin reductase